MSLINNEQIVLCYLSENVFDFLKCLIYLKKTFTNSNTSTITKKEQGTKRVMK